MNIGYPYAKAIFALALKQHKTKEWAALLELLVQVVADKKLHRLWTCPKSMQPKLIALLNEIAVQRLKPLTPFGENFLHLLINKKYLTFIPQIASLYKNFYIEYENIKNVKITTAFVLNDQQKQQIKSVLQRKLQHEVNLEYEIEPKIIGGMIIQIGDQIIDGSIISKLQRFINQKTDYRNNL